MLELNPEKINANAVEVCRVLNSYGYKAYIVGGCVRDLLLNLEPKDWDITTDAHPDFVQKMFEKTYPTGLQHGTVTVSMNEEHFEVTTFRVEGKYIDGRRPTEVEFVSKVEDDLGRRDLTINAIAYDPLTNILIDPHNGIKDLEDKIIRCVGSAIDRLTEDGLRIMRAARFSSRFNYKVDHRTAKAMRAAKDTLKLVSKERIADELKKLLMTANAIDGIILLDDLEILEIACPILVENKCYPLTYRHQVYEGELETRVATLYRSVDSNLVNKELVNLKFSNKEIKKILFLRNAFEEFCKIFPQWAYSIYDWKPYVPFIAYLKNNTPDTYEHSLKEFIAFTGRKELEGYFKNNEVFSRKELCLNGNDLLAMGVTAGPKIKEMLDSMYELILKTPALNNRDSLISYTKSIMT